MDLWASVVEAVKMLPSGESLGVSRVDAWSVAKVTVESPRNYFTQLPDNAVATQDGFVQELYAAFRHVETGGRTVPILVLVAPYVRLLNRILTQFTLNVGAPAVQYCTPVMEEVFGLFESTSFEWMDATRISVKDDSEPALDLVSLTGRNPLRSNLRRELLGLGPAYSIRLSVRLGASATNFHMDRFGNSWWYHRSDEDLTAALKVFDALLGSVAVNQGRHRPTYRVVPSSDAD
ncbi:MAG: hypothetical protein WAX14_01025 [Rhodococcus sp. (in: high G+C Gram-positive bacteria)]|uniref:hypothetical protein n=1 Tax=Rhodococcus sp. TaxID=1831 RepID=UPI003BB5ED5A